MLSFILLGILGPWQIIFVAALALLLFGGKKIPELMRGIGQGISEYKKATKNINDVADELKKIKN